MPATQADRPFRLKTPLGDDALLIDSFQGVERVSTPFRFVLKVLSLDPNVDMKGLLNQPAVLSIRSQRRLRAACARSHRPHEPVGVRPGWHGGVQAELAPWLWFLTLFADCRIFQNMAVPDIVQKVFSDRGFTD